MDVGPDAARLLKSAREVCLTGLETSTPLVRIGGTLFAGKWDELLGTELLFSVQKRKIAAGSATAAAAAATAVRRTSEHVRSQGVRHEDESASQVDREQEQEQEQEQGQGQGQEQDDSMPVDDAIIGEVQQKAGRGAGQDDAANENEEDERMGT
ncbi:UNCHARACTERIZED [Ceraceosorus bombacis]|uniref:UNCHARACTERIZED n=1 Tax=Ceraceosorus bombacis TaxID=401625 RepID=A0A0P1BNJ0_9BASI|nr:UNCHARACTERIZED [Ceraceosorus bombacis]